MGMTHRITGLRAGISWPTLRDELAQRGLPAQLRMIDAQLAFPAEEPPENWSELRIGMAAGMVTIRRETDAVSVVIWGNADEALRAAWTTLATAITQVFGGSIQLEMTDIP